MRTHTDGAPASPGSLRNDGGTPRRRKAGRPLLIGPATPSAHSWRCYRPPAARCGTDAQSTSPSDKKNGIKSSDLLILSSRNQPIDYFLCTSMHSRELICTRRRNHHMPAVLGIVDGGKSWNDGPYLLVRSDGVLRCSTRTHEPEHDHRTGRRDNRARRLCIDQRRLLGEAAPSGGLAARTGAPSHATTTAQNGDMVGHRSVAAATASHRRRRLAHGRCLVTSGRPGPRARRGGSHDLPRSHRRHPPSRRSL